MFNDIDESTFDRPFTFVPTMTETFQGSAASPSHRYICLLLTQPKKLANCSKSSAHIAVRRTTNAKTVCVPSEKAEAAPRVRHQHVAKASGPERSLMISTFARRSRCDLHSITLDDPKK